jgi:hypothetical protein
MDPLTTSALVFIAKAAGNIAGYAVVGQSARGLRTRIKNGLEMIDQQGDKHPELNAALDHLESGALDIAISEWRNGCGLRMMCSTVAFGPELSDLFPELRPPSAGLGEGT